MRATLSRAQAQPRRTHVYEELDTKRVLLEL